eukprot:4331003-Ditylum_brightwellii.AAC.1
MVEQQEEESQRMKITFMANQNAFVAETPASILLNTFVAEKTFTYADYDYDGEKRMVTRRSTMMSMVM